VCRFRFLCNQLSIRLTRPYSQHQVHQVEALEMIPTNPRRTIAIKLILALMVFLAPISSAWGAVSAGTVTHLSGPLLAKKADGRVRALSINSTVERVMC